MQNYKHGFFIGLISLMFVLNCGEKVPVKEMSLAKLEISKAVSVRAKQYAPKEIEEAENKLLESHEFLKKDALDKCKDSAAASREKAVAAYNKSIPLLAKDTLDIAKQSLEQADAAYAAVLAEKEYKQAEESYDKANELFENKEYYPCYEKAVEADGLAKDARNVAIGKKEILTKSIAEVKTVLTEAEKYNASVYAKDEVETAKENLTVAEESIGTLELKKGFAAMETAGTNADEAYRLAIEGTAKAKIEQAEGLHQEALNSEGAQFAKDEVKAAKEALDQSKALFQEEKYKDSISSAEESIRQSNIVLGSMGVLAKEKIASAELIYMQAKESEGASIAADQLKGAKDALDNSKTFHKESKFKESIASAAESERLSNIVIATRKKEGQVSSAATSSSAASEDYFIYKVRYIPERRDCLWRIAEKFYSNPFLWKNIYKANTDKIRNPDLIWPDMLLKVPKLTKKSDVEKAKETTSEPVKGAPATEPEKVKEAASEPAKETPATEPEKVKEAAPEPEKKSSTEPEKDNAIVPSKAEEEAPAEIEKKDESPAIEKENEVEQPETGTEETMPENSEEPLNEK